MFALALVTAAFAETPDWTVVVDPLTAALGYAHIQVERATSDRISIYAGPHLRLYDSLLGDDVEPFRGYGIESGVRWFPGAAPAAPTGWWIGARGVGAYIHTIDPEPAQSTFGGYVSALGGYTWIGAERWVLSGGAGVQYLRYTIAGYGPSGPFPALHTAAGVAF